MNPTAELEPVMTVPEMAAALRVDRSVIYKEISAGNIDAIRVGLGRGSIRIPVSEFRAYVAKRKTANTEASQFDPGQLAEPTAA